MQEILKDIKGYEGFYQVSNYGNIRSVDRVVKYGRKLKGKVLSQSVEKDGYFVVNLSKNGIAKTFKAHRLVAIAFLPNVNCYKEINHKDENKQNNCVENLEWCNTKYNINYGRRNKLVSEALYGEKAHTSKITQKDVDEIRELYRFRSKENNTRKLSEKYGISDSQVCRIIHNKRWKVNKED